ncbi:MAG: methyltransferase domain-containing protein [Gammaproteobacteria bacterium]|nr:methyltransferase domain-containing protein [Gammaproteobacteria bacterium]
MRGYSVKVESVFIGRVNFRIRSLLNVSQFSDPKGEAAAVGISSTAWPLFGVIWPSGRVLADAMSRFEFEGKRILELGCGIGLSSLGLHRRGANVVATDRHPLAEAFLIENMVLNELGPIKYRTADWRTADSTLGEFDVIIGSDVLYEREHPALVADFVARHAASRAEVLIVDPSRGFHNQFSRRMQAQGFVCSQQQLTGALTGGYMSKGQTLTYLR